MTLLSLTCYILLCDVCAKRYVYAENTVHFADPDNLRTQASTDGWTIRTDGHVLCPAPDLRHLTHHQDHLPDEPPVLPFDLEAQDDEGEDDSHLDELLPPLAPAGGGRPATRAAHALDPQRPIVDLPSLDSICPGDLDD